MRTPFTHHRLPDIVCGWLIEVYVNALAIPGCYGKLHSNGSGHEKRLPSCTAALEL